MNDIIIYGSKYGSTRFYAEKLSEQTGIPAVSYKEKPNLLEADTVIYLGGLYAGGVLGLVKTFRGAALREHQRLILITVGLADPAIQENQNHIRASLQRQISPELFDRARIFHLRGKIDYHGLSFVHRVMMKVLYRSLCKTPTEERTAENRAFIETYGKQANYTDLRMLEPIIREIRN